MALNAPAGFAPGARAVEMSSGQPVEVQSTPFLFRPQQPGTTAPLTWMVNTSAGPLRCDALTLVPEDAVGMVDFLERIRATWES